TFGAIPAVTVGKTGLVSAIATSKLAVSFSSATTGICSVNGAIVIGKEIGTCIIAANQAGNANYNPAIQMTQNIPVGKGAQVLTFGAIPAVTVGKTGLVSAIATSKLAVSFSSATTGICSVNGAIVIGKAVGTCIITANQAGNANYNPALQKIQSFTIGKGAQVLTFGATPVVTVGKTGFVLATASSRLVVAFTSKTPGVCSVTGNIITGKAVGTCIIAANQAGNANYSQAISVTKSFKIGTQLR
ncbi:MAG: hypothetical protein WCS87_15365, partial [Methylococcaceae bacterium]